MVIFQKIIIILVFLFYLLVAVFYSSNVVANGDEVRYLLMAHSIVKDIDIWLENNYAYGDQLLFNHIVQDKIAVRGLDNHEYLVHGIGNINPVLSQRSC